LRTEFTATKLAFTRFGVRRAVKDEKKAAMAQAVDANPDDVSAAKKLLDTKHPAYKEVTSIFSRCKAYWKEITMPFPQDGIRLLRQDVLNEFQADMQRYRASLDQATAALNEVYCQMRYDARQRLGDLFDSADYPDTLDGAFEIRWEFPSIDPPDYLKNVNKRIWEEQRAIADARLNEAVMLAEQAFAAEFGELLSKLVDRLTPNEMGEQKTFRDSVITNLSEFMGRFRFLSVGSNAELEELIQRAKDVIEGKTADDLRKNAYTRELVKQEMTKLGESLESMLVDTPRRSIILEDD